MNATTDRPSLTTPLLEARTRNGRPEQVWADGGAVSQEGRRPVHTCNTCHLEVVWVKSAKTGRWYRCGVSRYADNVNGGAGLGRYYVKANPHKCEQIMADRAERDAERAARELNEQREAQHRTLYRMGGTLQAAGLSIPEAATGMCGTDGWLLGWDETAESLAYGMFRCLPDLEPFPFGPGLPVRS